MEKLPDNKPQLRIEIRKCYDETETMNSKTARISRSQESHPEREILFVVSGKNSFLLNGKNYSATPGTAFFINQWIPHQCNYGTIRNDFTHVWIHFHEKKLFSVIYQGRHGERSHQHLTWEHSGHLLGLLNERWDRALQEAGSSAARQEIYMSIARILAEELTYLSTHEPQKIRSNSEQIPVWIKNYISMQYGRNISLPGLEKLTGYNRFYLMRLFKAEYGMTIRDYINCVRRGFASAAVRQGMRQKEIAMQLGFRSAAAYWLWKTRDSKREKEGKRRNPDS